MEITKIIYNDAKDYPKNVLAVCSVIFDDVFKITNLCLCEKRDSGTKFIIMPSEMNTVRKIENIVWANKRERILSILIIQYSPNLPLFLFRAYIEAAVCHIERYSQVDHAVVFAPVFLVV